MELSEREWLLGGLFWMVLAMLGSIPWGDPVALLGEVARWLVCMAAALHLIEALYAMSIARRRKIDVALWFRRCLVLGYLALRKLRTTPTLTPEPI